MSLNIKPETLGMIFFHLIHTLELNEKDVESCLVEMPKFKGNAVFIGTREAIVELTEYVWSHGSQEKGDTA